MQQGQKQVVSLALLPRQRHRLPHPTHFRLLDGVQTKHRFPRREGNLQRMGTPTTATEQGVPLRNLNNGRHIAPLTCSLGSAKDERRAATQSVGNRFGITSTCPHLVYHPERRREVAYLATSPTRFEIEPMHNSERLVAHIQSFRHPQRDIAAHGKESSTAANPRESQTHHGVTRVQVPEREHLCTLEKSET